MCVAIIKPCGVSMPSPKILEKCWNKNPDGAGFLFDTGMAYRIEKGFMDLKKLKRGLNKHRFGQDDFVVIHFRRSTSGDVTPENTHPFPLSSHSIDLQALSVECQQAMLHNGRLGPSEGNLSDTAIYVRDVLSQNTVNKFLDTTGIQNAIKYAVGTDKMLILDKEKGLTVKFGNWEYEKSNGLYFSNTLWRNSTGASTRLCPDCKIKMVNVFSKTVDWYCASCQGQFVLEKQGQLRAVGKTMRCPLCDTHMGKIHYAYYISAQKVSWECKMCDNKFSENSKGRLNQLTSMPKPH